jgi:streptogramin lyase
VPGGEADDGAPHVRRRGPDGQVFFASLAGNYLGQIDLETGATTVLEGKSGPTTQQA